MKAFVTGGTGFIGRRVVHRLIQHGYDVTCLVRRSEKAHPLRQLGATLVPGDVTNPESMRAAMTGVDVVFHIAGMYEIGLPPAAAARMEQVNVNGTENALGLAVELGVPKIVYTSTAGVLGDTFGAVVDETHRRDSPFGNAYERTKFDAHKIAERFIAKGAPIIIVMPGGTYGPGDHSMLGTLLRLVLRHMLPVMPGADTAFSFAHVDDVAEGHVLAAEKGRIGEAYILAGDVMTVGDFVQLVARLAGVPAPLLLLDSSYVMPLLPLVRQIERFMPLPPLLSSEAISSLGTTWMVTSAKAERELGYTHRPIEEGLAETILWEAAQLHRRSVIVQPRILLAVAVGAFLLGRIPRPRGRK